MQSFTCTPPAFPVGCLISSHLTKMCQWEDKAMIKLPLGVNACGHGAIRVYSCLSDRLRIYQDPDEVTEDKIMNKAKQKIS